MRIRMGVFSVLAIVGLLGTWKYNLAFMGATGGFDVVAFARAPFASPAAASIGVDFYVSCAAGIIFLVSEARRLRMRHWWIYLVLLGVAWAVAFPLFLLQRERVLAARGGTA